MKKNKFEFIIDSEFQSQIPALTDEEFQQLEENILSEGEVLSPLIVWGNILVDGHNRYKILQQHPEIPYTTRSISCTCETREDVLAWIQSGILAFWIPSLTLLYAGDDSINGF